MTTSTGEGRTSFGRLQIVVAKKLLLIIGRQGESRRQELPACRCHITNPRSAYHGRFQRNKRGTPHRPSVAVATLLIFRLWT